MRTFSRAPWRSRRRRWLNSLSLALLSGACVWADEPADRVAIDRTIAALNEVPSPGRLYTADADVSGVLEQLRKGKRPTYRPVSSAPSVTISHEPWREATINLPGAPWEIVNPRIGSGSLRFITPDVAMVDGTFTYQDGGTTQTTPLLFVVKKEGSNWRIVSLRVLARLQ